MTETKKEANISPNIHTPSLLPEWFAATGLFYHIPSIFGRSFGRNLGGNLTERRVCGRVKKEISIYSKTNPPERLLRGILSVLERKISRKEKSLPSAGEAQYHKKRMNPSSCIFRKAPPERFAPFRGCSFLGIPLFLCVFRYIIIEMISFGTGCGSRQFFWMGEWYWYSAA